MDRRFEPRFPPSRIPRVARRAFDEFRKGLERARGGPVTEREALAEIRELLGRDERNGASILAAPEGEGNFLLFVLCWPEARKLRALGRRR